MSGGVEVDDLRRSGRYRPNKFKTILIYRGGLYLTCSKYGLLFYAMDFEKNDLVVVRGYQKTANKTAVLADIFKVLFVGAHELVLVARTKYAKAPFKIPKSRCINLKIPEKVSLPLPPIQLGDLVLGYDVDYSGDIKDQKVGHVTSIIDNPNSKKYYVITSKNVDTMFEEDKVLLLQ